MSATPPESVGRQARGVVVRLAEPGDLDDVLRLYDELAGERRDARPATAGGAKRLFDALCADENRFLLLAVVRGRSVGTADVIVVPNLTHGGRSWAIVENVVVDPRHRRRGVGRALMDDAVRRCEQSGCYKVQLLSKKERRQAHSFYRGVGFEALAEGFRRYLE